MIHFQGVAIIKKIDYKIGDSKRNIIVPHYFVPIMLDPPRQVIPDNKSNANNIMNSVLVPEP